jgi:hypothetical protein
MDCVVFPQSGCGHTGNLFAAHHLHDAWQHGTKRMALRSRKSGWHDSHHSSIGMVRDIGCVPPLIVCIFTPSFHHSESCTRTLDAIRSGILDAIRSILLDGSSGAIKRTRTRAKCGLPPSCCRTACYTIYVITRSRVRCQAVLMPQRPQMATYSAMNAAVQRPLPHGTEAWPVSVHSGPMVISWYVLFAACARARSHEGARAPLPASRRRPRYPCPLTCMGVAAVRGRPLSAHKERWRARVATCRRPRTTCRRATRPVCIPRCPALHQRHAIPSREQHGQLHGCCRGRRAAGCTMYYVLCTMYYGIW